MSGRGWRHNHFLFQRPSFRLLIYSFFGVSKRVALPVRFSCRYEVNVAFFFVLMFPFPRVLRIGRMGTLMRRTAAVPDFVAGTFGPSRWFFFGLSTSSSLMLMDRGFGRVGCVQHQKITGTRHETNRACGVSQREKGGGGLQAKSRRVVTCLVMGAAPESYVL